MLSSRRDRSYRATWNLESGIWNPSGGLKGMFAFYMIRRVHVPLVFGAGRAGVGADRRRTIGNNGSKGVLMFKRVTYVLLSVAFVLTFVACGGKKEEEEEEEAPKGVAATAAKASPAAAAPAAA